VQIAGEWESSDNLSNQGEQLKLSHGGGTAIRDFIYGVTAPWPTEANAGRALVLIAPHAVPDHGSPASWRASAVLHGTPGLPDGTSFAQWAAANGVTDPALDEDQDGLNNFGEYNLGGSPAENSPSPLPQGSRQQIAGVNYLTLTFRRNLRADDVRFSVEGSEDVVNWFNDSAHVVFVSKTEHEDGTATFVYRTAQPFNTKARQFLRLRMTEILY
jgi:hypothetical protein